MVEDRKPGDPLIIARPLDWSGDFSFSESAKNIHLIADENGQPYGIMAVPCQPDGVDGTIKGIMPVAIRSSGGVYATILDAPTGQIWAGGVLQSYAFTMVSPYGTYWENKRTPSVFKNVLAVNNGATALWTPAAGKKFRLMGGCVTLLKGTTAAATCVLTLTDNAAATGIGVSITTGALTAPTSSNIILQFDIGNGYLSAAADQVLNATLSSALAVCGVSIQVWGTEE